MDPYSLPPSNSSSNSSTGEPDGLVCSEVWGRVLIDWIPTCLLCGQVALVFWRGYYSPPKLLLPVLNAVGSLLYTPSTILTYQPFLKLLGVGPQGWANMVHFQGLDIISPWLAVYYVTETATMVDRCLMMNSRTRKTHKNPKMRFLWRVECYVTCMLALTCVIDATMSRRCVDQNGAYFADASQAAIITSFTVSAMAVPGAGFIMMYATYRFWKTMQRMRLVERSRSKQRNFVIFKLTIFSGLSSLVTSVFTSVVNNIPGMFDAIHHLIEGIRFLDAVLSMVLGFIIIWKVSRGGRKRKKYFGPRTNTTGVKMTGTGTGTGTGTSTGKESTSTRDSYVHNSHFEKSKVVPSTSSENITTEIVSDGGHCSDDDDCDDK